MATVIVLVHHVTRVPAVSLTDDLQKD